MSDHTGIEWTDATWNPIVGCSKVSPGCDNCYAEIMAKRLAAMSKSMGRDRLRDKYASVIGPYGWNGTSYFDAEELVRPIRWKKSKRIFVTSMGDLFHESADLENILQVFGVMHDCPQHTFQVLSKRPERMVEFCERWGLMPQHPFGFTGSGEEWPVNVWAGATIENQEQAEARLPHLFRVPAEVLWVSIEPMLGPVNILPWLMPACRMCGGSMSVPAPGGGKPCPRCIEHQGIDPVRIRWVVVGGETGHRARPVHPNWVRSVSRQCEMAGVAFFFKGWGDWAPFRDNGPLLPICSYVGIDGDVRIGDAEAETDYCMGRVGKKAAGRLLENRTWDAFPQK